MALTRDRKPVNPRNHTDPDQALRLKEGKLRTVLAGQEDHVAGQWILQSNFGVWESSANVGALIIRIEFWGVP